MYVKRRFKYEYETNNKIEGKCPSAGAPDGALPGDRHRADRGFRIG